MRPARNQHGSAVPSSTRQRIMAFLRPVRLSVECLQVHRASQCTYALVLVPTNLQAPINWPVETVDWNGDGMNDVRFKLNNGPNSNFYATTDLGPYVSRAQRARRPG